MIKFWFVRLYLWEVPVIKVARIFEVCVSKNYDSASPITKRQVFSCFVETHGGEDVSMSDIDRISLAQPIYVDPV